MQENNSQLLIYQNEYGETKLDVRFQDETSLVNAKVNGRAVSNFCA